MFRIALGSYLIQASSWDSEGEMALGFNKCTLGAIRIGDNRYPNDEIYSLTVHSDEGTFGIGIVTYHNGILPSMICNTSGLSIAIGFGTNVYIVDIATRKLFSTLSLDDEFYQFHTLEHLGIQHRFLVQSEMAVTACTDLGDPIWRYSGNDIISRVLVSQSQVEIHHLDGSRDLVRPADGTPL